MVKIVIMCEGFPTIYEGGKRKNRHNHWAFDAVTYTPAPILSLFYLFRFWLAGSNGTRLQSLEVSCSLSLIFQPATRQPQPGSFASWTCPQLLVSSVVYSRLLYFSLFSSPPVWLGILTLFWCYCEFFVCKLNYHFWAPYPLVALLCSGLISPSMDRNNACYKCSGQISWVTG